ncbi:MAG: TatD family deoxyribonuclease [Chloroflexota bacterium]|nr:MAG: TatD family deoxyribonuclease [Chloroflexota bacterium]
MALVDSHCHLASSMYDDDRDEVVARATEAGVDLMVCPATDVQTTRATIDLARNGLAIVPCAGIHPNDPTIHNRDGWRVIADLARDPLVTCIGETGLDYFRQTNDSISQRAAFTWHLALASELGYPIIIHNRNADRDVLRAVADWRGNDPSRVAVLHCFVGPISLVEEAIELGCYFGIGGPITFGSADAVREAARRIPLDRVLIETDSPFLSPAPRRGERNEPAHAAIVARRLADVLGLTSEEVARRTSANARAVFGAPVVDR